MKRLSWIVLSVAFVTSAAFTAPPRAVGALDSPCYAADSYSAGELADLQAVVTATDSVSAQWRRNVHLPVVVFSAVTLVADSATCASALIPFNSATRYAEGPATKLYLFSVGNTYVGVNPNFASGEWVQHIVMDSTFSVLKGYLK